MLHCRYCGKELPYEYTSVCPSCGKSIDARPATEEKVSNAWYLLPIFMSWIGGLIMYFVVKDKDPRKAKRGLILGIAITAGSLAIYGIFFLIMGSMFESIFEDIAFGPDLGAI